MFLETSAKTAENVNDVSDFCYNYQAFNSSAKMVLDNILKNNINLDENKGLKIEAKIKDTNVDSSSCKC